MDELASSQLNTLLIPDVQRLQKFHEITNI